MKNTWNKLDKSQVPSKGAFGDYISNPLFENLCEYIEEQYQANSTFDYSGCSMQKGWNMKYKKSGRGLCTLYPMEGYFIALVVIGEREHDEVELMLPTFTAYLQNLYRETKVGMGQRWLMIEVTDNDILNDVKKCIEIRREAKKTGVRILSQLKE